MLYFCMEPERKGTCYHEFYMGKFDGVSFWQKDSILIHDDVHDALGMPALFSQVLPGYSPFAQTEVNEAQWRAILAKAETIGGELLAAVREADAWAHLNFQTHSVFTMLGI